jgi:hypothetical protein
MLTRESDLVTGQIGYGMALHTDADKRIGLRLIY